MTLIESSRAPLTKEFAFRIFKIVIFLILMVNLFYYLYEDVVAYLYLAPGFTFFDTLESFAVTIDYVAWMLLIVLLEMETSAQARDQLQGTRKWVIGVLTAGCYVVLVYAAYGYVAGLRDAYSFEPIESARVCDLAEGHFAYLTTEARPIELTKDNCGVIAKSEVFRSSSNNLIATHFNLLALQKLGWIDVINSSVWLFVVLLFQIEVSLRLAKKLTKRRLIATKALKGILYLALLGCATYWTVYSAFIDSWDAWIWLLAFLLIDLNLLGLDSSQKQQRVSSDIVTA